MDDTILILTIVGIIVGIVAAVAAIFAAVYTYPAWRASKRRPLLRVVAELRSSSRSEGRRVVVMFLRLHNYGESPAVGWRFILITGRKPWAKWGESVGRFRDDESQSDGDRVMSWQAASAHDTIEPGRDGVIGVSLMNYDGERVSAQYVLDAVGMDTYRGAVEVRWPEGEDEPTVWPPETAYGLAALARRARGG